MPRVILVRHGQASFGAANYDQLSPLGYEQAEARGRALRKRGGSVERVVTGGLQRHAQTLEGIRRAHSELPDAKVDRGFDEFDHRGVLARFGDEAVPEVKDGREARRKFEEAFERAILAWMSEPATGSSAPEERWDTFRDGARATFTRLLGDLDRRETALVVSSAGTIAAIVSGLLALDERRTWHVMQSLVNAGQTVVVQSPFGPRLATLNEHTPFEGPGAALRTFR